MQPIVNIYLNMKLFTPIMLIIVMQPIKYNMNDCCHQR